jgi:hypothetical protein
LRGEKKEEALVGVPEATRDSKRLVVAGAVVGDEGEEGMTKKQGSGLCRHRSCQAFQMFGRKKFLESRKVMLIEESK